MTRKDYVKFAAMLKKHNLGNTRGSIGYAKDNAFKSIASDTADIFAADNPNFDRARFLAACGVNS